MTTITFTAGATYNAQGRQIADVETRLSTIRKYLALHYGGFTETHTVGGWIDDSGAYVEEAGKQWIVYTDHSAFAVQDIAHQSAAFIADTLEQNCVVLAMRSGEFVEMVEGKAVQASATVAYS